MNDINLWAVLLAAALSFALGGLWYSRLLFEGLWIREAKDPRLGFTLIAALAFAYWVGPRAWVIAACFSNVLYFYRESIRDENQYHDFGASARLP